MGLTLNKYIFNEIWPTFLVSLFVAIFIILATRMLSIIELVVNRGAHAVQMGMMLLYLVPDIVVFALPAATLMAVLVEAIPQGKRERGVSGCLLIRSIMVTYV